MSGFSARLEAHARALLCIAVALAIFGSGEALALTVWHSDTVTTPVALGAVGSGPGLLVAGGAEAPGGRQPAPTSVTIPSIKVSSPLVDLHVDGSGVLGVPTDYSMAGWWTEGTAPGDVGPAVIVGHVDSTRGAAVFYRLHELKPGDTVDVARADGASITFRVDAVRQYAKAALPTDIVYGPTATPALRLITCGGAFDKSRRQYEENVVVFASMVIPTAPVTPAPAGA